MAASDWIGPAITAGTSLLQGGQSKKNVKRTIKANRELAEYSYGQDREMWAENNAYNSPEQQMERLKKAGLNPNMVYGSGTVAGNSSTATPKYNAPTEDYTRIQPMVNPMAMLQAYQDMELKKAQTDNVKAQTNNLDTRTGIEAGIKEATRWMDYDQKKHNLMMAEHVDPMKASITYNQTQAAQFLTEEARQKLANLIQQGKNMKAGEANIEADTLFKKYRNEWMKMGFTTSDNVGFRLLAKAFNEILGIDSVGELSKYGGKIFKPNR